MTYDLRRLRPHGLIARIPRTRRYQITDTSLTRRRCSPAPTTTSCGWARRNHRPRPARPSRLRAADRAYQTAFNDIARYAHLAA